jgi:GAF domain-containing protein
MVCIPGEGLSKSHRRPEAQLPDDATLHRLASTELVARAMQSAEPLRVDKARTAPEAAPFCFVSVPLRREERVVGVLAAFATLARRPFSVQDAEQVTDAAAQLAELLR